MVAVMSRGVACVVFTVSATGAAAGATGARLHAAVMSKTSVTDVTFRQVGILGVHLAERHGGY